MKKIIIGTIVSLTGIVVIFVSFNINSEISPYLLFFSLTVSIIIFSVSLTLLAIKKNKTKMRKYTFGFLGSLLPGFVLFLIPIFLLIFNPPENRCATPHTFMMIGAIFYMGLGLITAGITFKFENIFKRR